MEMEALQPDEIQKLSEGLVQAKLVLDFRLLHDTIILFLGYLRDKNDKTMGILVMQARGNALKLHGWTVGRKTICTVGFSKYLTDEIKTYQDLLDSAALFATHAQRANRQGLARYIQTEVAGSEAHIERLEELRGTLPEMQE